MSGAAEFPDDDHGDALRRIAEDGSDMSQPMDIDFHVAAPSQPKAEEAAAALMRSGREVDVYGDDDEGWTVEVKITMVPEHAEIVRIEAELGAEIEGFGCEVDGWGTWGNAPG